MKLTAEKRTATSKGELAKIRRAGDIPAVLYSLNEKNRYLTIKGKEFDGSWKTVPHGRLSTTVYSLQVEEEVFQVIVKEIQYHPITYKIIHLDFLVLEENKFVKVNIPVRIIGIEECVGIKLGGFLRKMRHHIPVRCLARNIPKEFVIDIEDMKIRSTKKGKDLLLPSGVELQISPNDVIVGIGKR